MNSQQPSLPLCELLPKVSWWRQTNELEFVAYLNAAGGEKRPHTVSAAELRAEHALLPGIITAYLRSNAQPYNDPAGGMVVLETLKLATQPKIEFQDMLGNMRRVMNIKELSVVERTPANILIRGDFVDTLPVEIDGTKVDLVEESYPTYHFAKRADLETRYPGWAARWRIGKEIGVDLPALAQYAFTGQSAGATLPELNHVAFD